MAESRGITVLEDIDNNTGYQELLPFNDVYRTKLRNFEGGVGLSDENETEQKYSKINLPPVEIIENKMDFMNYSEVLQSWVGHITKINEDGFIAELYDLTNRGTIEIADFDYEDVSPEDKSLVGLGSTFYWTISRKKNRGQISNESILRFQRLVNWDFDDVNRLEEKLNNRLQNLNFVD